MAVVHDMSEMAKSEGIKVHVVSTGAFKGAFTPGSEVTEEQLADLQSLVNKLNGFFKEAVADSRSMDMKTVDALFDGRVHVAEDAMAMGLIDAVEGFDDAMRALAQAIPADDLAEAEALARARSIRSV